MGQAGKHRLYRVKFRYFTHLVDDASHLRNMPQRFFLKHSLHIDA